MTDESKATLMKTIGIAVEILLLILAVAWTCLVIRGCAQPGGKTVEAPNPEACSTPNQVKQVSCPAGQSGYILQICKDGSFQQSFSSCVAGSCPQTTFDKDVAPFIVAHCVSCHAAFTTESVAVSQIDEMIRRTGLSPDDPGRMPKAPNQPLSDADKAIFTKWKSDGLLATCANSSPTPNAHLTLDDVELAIESDLNTLNSGAQVNTRYLVTTHKSDEGASADVLSGFAKGVQKGINQMSLKRGIVLAQPVDSAKTVWRFNLLDLGLTAKDWNLIEGTDPVNLESFTNRGLTLKNITRTKKPWLHVDSFTFSSLQAKVYYNIKKISADANTFLSGIGVNINNQLDDFEALQAGFSNSPISLKKNRLITRFDSNDGYAWITFDIDNVAAANKNLFQAPLLKSASGKTTFISDASEVIASQANGLQQYALFNNKGVRLDAAALNVVADNISPFTPEIQNALSCSRCHNAGLILAKDEVKAHVDQNAAQFDLRDVDLVDQLYRDVAPVLKADIDSHSAALAKMGILASEADPTSLVADNLRRNQTADSVAALLFLKKDEFLNCLSQSAEGRSQVGQLLTGGEVTFEQLIASLPVILRDCKVGQNPIIP